MQDIKWLSGEALLRRPYLAKKRRKQKKVKKKGQDITEGRVPKNSKKR